MGIIYIYPLWYNKIKMEEFIMVKSIIGVVIGLLIAIFGIYYFVKEKSDKESRKIYSIISAVGGIITIISVILLIFSAK